MSLDEFNDVLDKYANKDLFIKEDNKWVPKFIPGTNFNI
jgi:hypothetical protein